jgi:hypothetical protein
MSKKLLPFFSYVFHPLFIPLFGTLFYLLFFGSFFPIEYSYLLLFQIVIITIFLPLSFIYLLKTIGKVDTVMLSEIHQRKIPLLMQLALMSVLLYKSVTIDRFPELFWFFLGGFVSTLIAFGLLFLKIKASIHMLGICALTFFVCALSIQSQTNMTYTIAFLFLLIGIVATSRLYMKAHTITELVIGIVLGSIPQIVLWRFWL